MIHRSKSKGFTLLELMIVMILLSILALLLIGNYMSSIKKGRDSRRKNDLNQIQRALEMYYEDTNRYPVLTDAELFGKKLCNTAPDWNNCTKSYMVKVPTDPNSNYSYHYVTDGTSSPQFYYIYSAIENDQDQSQNVSIKGYVGIDTSCGSTSVICRYFVSSSNAPLPTPKP